MPESIDETLEAASSDTFWVMDDITIVERPEIHYLAHTEPNPLFNRVMRSRGDVEQHRALVDEVVAAHAHGVTHWMLNPMNDSDELRDLLRERGFEPGSRHYAYALECSAYDRPVPEDVEVREVETIDDLVTLYALNRDAFGSDRNPDRDRLAGELAFCTGPDRRVARFIAYRDGEPVGAAGMTFFDDLDFALLWAGGVAPEHRGKGVYTALLAARARLAEARGIRAFGLYARVDTSAPIVAAQGFERHGHMDYFVRDERS